MSSTRKIPLTHGQVAIVDVEDYEELSRFKWKAHLDKGRAGKYYAYRHEKTEEGRRTIILMHRQILSPAQGMQVDHRNHKTLDNRRANIRACTAAQNQHNRPAPISNTTGYKGVTKTASGKFLAKIRYGGANHTIGRFAIAEDAAMAYDDVARREHGEFAHPNFPTPTEISQL